MHRLDDAADYCQTFIDGDTDRHQFFVTCESMQVEIPKTVLMDVLTKVLKGITEQYEKLEKEFEAL